LAWPNLQKTCQYKIVGLVPPNVKSRSWMVGGFIHL